MFKVVGFLLAIWTIVLVIVLLMLATNPMTTSLVNESVTAIEASGNVSQMPGIVGAVASFPVWRWLLPVFLGLVASAFLLYENRDELRRR